jgi:polysaccharide export outer membrane protein
MRGWMCLSLAAWLLTTTMATAQAAGSETSRKKDGLATITVDRQNVLLGSGDTIRVSFFDTPEMTVDAVTVGSDGTVKLPLIGNVPVAGLNTSAAAHQIDSLYRSGGFVLNPQSSVSILNFALNGVSVVGEVGKPGNYAVTGSRTLLDVISMAGGLTTSADTRIVVERSDGKIEDTVDLPADSGTEMLRNDVLLSAGDKVVVQRAGMVYVLGDVGKPGGYLMHQNGKITVMQAIAFAGGSTRISAEKKAYLLQQNKSGYSTTVVSLRDMYKGKASDISMSSGDILYVPSSNVRNFVFNAPQVLGAIGGAAVYATSR